MKFKSYFIAVATLVVVACQPTKEQKETNTFTPEHTFYVGTYTNIGDSKGIYQYAIDTAGHLQKIKLLAETEDPSFLAKSNNNRYLLAVNELEQGGLSSFTIETDTLIFNNQVSTEGMHPCYVSTNKRDYVLAANYSSGNVSLFKLQNDGTVSELLDQQQHEGSDTTDRQKGPHAHFANFFPNNPNEAVAVDLGANELYFYSIDSDSSIIKQKNEPVKMASGAGPRHVAFHPNNQWLYVINELNGTVTQLVKEKEGYRIGKSISTLPEDFEGENTCADIHVSADGKFLYGSNRGHNSIAIYQIAPADGTLSLIGFESTKGDGPRNFTLSPDENFLLVANQNTNNIVSFRRDKTTGKLSFIEEVEAPTPVCLLF